MKLPSMLTRNILRTAAACLIATCRLTAFADDELAHIESLEGESSLATPGPECPPEERQSILNRCLHVPAPLPLPPVPGKILPSPADYGTADGYGGTVPVRLTAHELDCISDTLQVLINPSDPNDLSYECACSAGATGLEDCLINVVRPSPEKKPGEVEDLPLRDRLQQEIDQYNYCKMIEEIGGPECMLPNPLAPTRAPSS